MGRAFVRSLIMAAVIGEVAVLAEAPAAAQGSTMDAHRVRATALFDRRLSAVSTIRTALADDRTTYERACRGKATTGRGIGVVFLRSELLWFSQTLRIDNETTPACRMLATGMKTRAHHVARELDQIDEDARRRGIYPGAMRDLKRQYGLEP